MRIGVDTGGMFTDCVVAEGSAVKILKVFSTPDDAARGIAQGIRQLAGTGRTAALEIVHGTTIGTNSLLERRGAKVALVTTAGFEDLIEIGRQNRPSLYELNVLREPPLVPSALRFGVNERTGADGKILQKPSPAELKRLRSQIQKSGAESIAVCLLFSFANPANEMEIARALIGLRLPVSVSHEILREFREFERVSSTTINTFLAPRMGAYLSNLGRVFADRSTHSPVETRDSRDISLRRASARVYVMQSSDGITTAERAAREPVRTILSGPAGGVVAAASLAMRMGIERVISFDMGGTSTDVCLARRTNFYLDALQRYSTKLMRAALRKIPEGIYRATDILDDDGFSNDPIPLRVSIKIRRSRARVDFSGTSRQCRGSVNAVFAITYSAVFYVFRCLLGEDVPACAGLMSPIEVRAPEGSVVNARPPAAVAAGNVETSQRIVDVLFRALARALPNRIPAASSGTMNNLSFGGINPRTGESFTYYETIAGGMGARPTADGLSGVHTHMTNSLNTPIEALESAYPVRVHRYSLRLGSNGAGAFRGGDGIVREIEFLTDVRGSILSDRRRSSPYGLKGGRPGQPGRTSLTTRNGSVQLPSKITFEASAGSILCVETPGGGGWGRQAKAKGKAQKARSRAKQRDL